jgi:hypothetical protein
LSRIAERNTEESISIPRSCADADGARHGTARRGALALPALAGPQRNRYLGEELVECSDGLVVEALGEVLVDLHKRTATAATDRDADALMTTPTARTPDENDGAAAAAATPFAASAHRAGDGWAGGHHLEHLDHVLEALVLRLHLGLLRVVLQHLRWHARAGR